MAKSKLTKKDIKALTEAVEKYRRVAKATPDQIARTDLGPKSCGLCQRYRKFVAPGDHEVTCEGCPISRHSGQSRCEGTPYNWRDGHGNSACLGWNSWFHSDSPAEKRTFRRQARKMADYMEDILRAGGVEL